MASLSGELRPRRRTILWTAVTVGVLLAVLVAVLATRKSATDQEAGSPLLGKPAPALAGPDLSGHQVSLADFRGKYVLVNFFATWCIPCQQEHPELIAFDSRHRPLGDALLLGVIYDKNDADRVAPFFAQHGGSWSVIRDDHASVDFGTSGVPETFLIDPQGYVLTRITGRVTDSGLEALVQRAEAVHA